MSNVSLLHQYFLHICINELLCVLNLNALTTVDASVAFKWMRKHWIMWAVSALKKRC